MTNETKFCKDCRHFMQGDGKAEDALCARAIKPEKRADYLVTGEGKGEQYFFCATERQAPDQGSCGETARHFEAKGEGV